MSKKDSTTTTKETTTEASRPTEAQIRERAYDLWEKAGRPENNSESYWLEAEKQLTKEAKGS